MYNFLIFLPECAYEGWKSGYVCGTIYHTDSGTAIYVHRSLQPSKRDCLSHHEIIGEFGFNNGPSRTSINWLFIQLEGNHLEKICVNSELPCSIRLVLYNRDHIKRSQWLDRMQFLEDDFVFRLVKEVKSEKETDSVTVPFSNNTHIFRGAQLVTYSLQRIQTFTRNQWISPMIKISTFGVHFFAILEYIGIILKQLTDGQRLNVHEINYIFARVLDMFLGQLIILYVMNRMSSVEMFSALSDFEEFVVAYLKNTVEWLMGSPAGFKLNCPLNNVLGPFYQFHISLWWTFLRLSKPLLWVIFHFLLFLGNFGLSLQVAILADVLAIVSVHIYCIYVYAARIYFFQMKGLKILSRLFIGKKRNPLPGTEYSSPYTTVQLLFGTVSFTILLFLLPTTLIYYCVFTAIRIVLILLGGIFTRIRCLMMMFPIYVTWLWFHDPVRLTCTVRLSNKMCYLRDGTLVTKIKPVCQSWRRTVQMSTADYAQNYSAAIEWRKLITDLLIGNLIYPV